MVSWLLRAPKVQWLSGAGLPLLQAGVALLGQLPCPSLARLLPLVELGPARRLKYSTQLPAKDMPIDIGSE